MRNTFAMQADGCARQNNFNFLRFVLASLVIVSHSPEILDGNRSRELLTMVFGTLSSGELAVNGFFILSGYLIMQSWILVPDPWRFLRSRVLRIYPGFIVASLISIFVVGYVGGGNGYLDQIWVGGVVRNIALLQRPETPPTFVGTHQAGVNGSMWTIAIEFTCYLAVLLAGLAGIARHRVLAPISFLLLEGAFFAQHLGFLSQLPIHKEGFRLGMCFAAGATFYLYRDIIPWSRKLACACVALLMAGLMSPLLCTPVVTVFGAYLLFYLAFAPVKLLVPFRRLPDISYGIYLYGWPAQKLIVLAFPTVSPFGLTVGALAVAGCAGRLSWTFIEKPALFLKDRKAAQRSGVTVLTGTELLAEPSHTLSMCSQHNDPHTSR